MSIITPPSENPAAATETKPRRRLSGWKITGIVSGALLLGVLIFSFWVNSVATRRWAEMEKRVGELTAEARARASERPVLRGEAVAGSAWEDYEQALKEVQKFKASNAVLAEFITRGPKADRTKVEALLAAHAGALDHLRRGAQRSNGQYPVAWEQGFEAKIPGLVDSQMLANLAVAQARVLAEAGKHGEAIELLTDTAQFGRDLGSNNMLIAEMIGIAVMGIAHEELKTMLQSGKLTGETLARLSKELEVLDRSFVLNGPVLVNEVLGMGSTMVKTGLSGVTGDMFAFYLIGGWRYGFSGRLMVVDAFFTHEEIMRKCAACDGKTWAEALKVGEEVEAFTKGIKNPMLQMVMPGMATVDRTVRERRAHLRLLRAAVHYRQTGEVLDIDDPFGGKILSSRAGTKLTLWSVARNGKDDGGVGGWKPAPENQDLVLEIER